MNTSSVQEYLKQKLENCSKYVLSDVDKILIEKEGIEGFIYKKLTSKKFRKWSLGLDQQTKIKSIIHDRVSNSLPLLFTFPFGGYKLWKLPTSPEVDWAEFFSIAYFLEYLAPISTVYAPGFEFLLISDEVIIERMNNVPKEDTEKYTKSLLTLIDEFTKFTQKNITFELKLVRDLYSSEEFEVELAKLIPKDITGEWENQPELKKEKRMKMSGMNVKMDGKEKWNELSKEEQENIIKKSSIVHDVYISLPKRFQLAKGPDKIIIFTSSIPGIPCIAVGSTKSSVNKFWIGVGVLEISNDTYKEVVLSPTQINKVATISHETIAINLIPLRNLQSIDVYKEKLRFEEKT